MKQFKGLLVLASGKANFSILGLFEHYIRPIKNMSYYKYAMPYTIIGKNADLTGQC